MENRSSPVSRLQMRTVFADGHSEQTEEAVLSEHTLELSVNGALFSHIVCTQTALRELVVGRLCTECLIGNLDDLAELRFSHADTKAAAHLFGNPQKRPLRPLEAANAWESGQVFALAKRFLDGMPLHDETFSTHSAFLLRGETVLCSYEDISRHNAVDKAVGHALLEGVPLSECMLFTSGRVPLDMAEKAIAAGIPVLVSKAAATAQAIHLAETYGLTLLCRARPDSYIEAASREPASV